MAIDPTTLAQLQKQFGLTTSTPVAKKKKGGLSAFISEAGGTGGAIGGATAGAALGSIVPGIGTAIGGVLGGVAGGFLGGFGGKAVEQKVRDNQNLFGPNGSFKASLGEGALSGALAAIPGGRAAGSVSKVGAGTVRGGGKLSRLGNAARASQRGIAPGIDMGGGKTLSTVSADAENAIIDKITKGGKGITKTGQYTQVEKEVFKNVEKYANSSEAAKTFTKKQADDVLARLRANIADNPSLAQGFKGQGAKTYKAVQNEIKALGGKTNKDFVELVSGKINSRYRTTSSGGNKGSIEAQVYEAARDAMKGHIDDVMATRSSINKELSTLLGAQKSLSKTITRDNAAGAAQGLTIGRLLSNAAGPGLDVAGRGAQQLGKVTNTTAARQATRQIGGRAVLAGALGYGQGQQPQDPSMEGQDVFSSFAGGQGSAPSNEDLQMLLAQGSPQAEADSTVNGYTPQQQEDQSQQSPYSIENAIADMQRDPQNAAKYQSYYKFVNDAFKPDKKAIKAQDAVASGSQALNIIDQLEQQYNESGGAAGRVPGLAATIAGKAGFNDAVNVYNDNKMAFLSNVARSLGEKGVLTDADIARVAGAFPGPTANPAEAAAKWAMIRTIIAGGIQKAQDAYSTTDTNASYIIGN